MLSYEAFLGLIPFSPPATKQHPVTSNLDHYDEARESHRTVVASASYYRSCTRVSEWIINVFGSRIISYAGDATGASHARHITGYSVFMYKPSGGARRVLTLG